MPARSDLVIGTAGHIDHGKTALVQALTGVDTDRLPAEKRRGITIDLGFAALPLPGGHRLALVDVPGHERFIRNMLAGASGLDLALLIVAADDSVMPQTREHLEILRLLGLAGGVVALTKVRPRRRGLARDGRGGHSRTLVAGTFLEGAEIVADLGHDRPGDRRPQAEALGPACRDDAPTRARFRASSGWRSTASFTLAGHGTVVTGTVASGELSRKGTTWSGSPRGKSRPGPGAPPPRPKRVERIDSGGPGGDQPRGGPPYREISPGRTSWPRPGTS